MSLPRLTVVCTDKGAHTERTLGFLHFEVQRDRGITGPGGGSYPIRAMLGDELADYLRDPIYGPPEVSLTAPGGGVGGWRRNRNGQVWHYPAKKDGEQRATVHKRKDGGHMFTFTCPTCGRSPELRDDYLTKLGAHWSSDVLDISQIGR